MQDGKLIFRARFDRRRWLFLLIGPGTALLLLLDERSFRQAPWAGLIATLVIAAMIIAASRYDGRERIAGLWRDGDVLTARMYRAIGPGPSHRLSAAAISDWQIYRWQNSQQNETGLRFRHGGRGWRLPLSAADFVDLTEVQRLSGLDGSEPQGRR